MFGQIHIVGTSMTADADLQPKLRHWLVFSNFSINDQIIDTPHISALNTPQLYCREQNTTLVELELTMAS